MRELARALLLVASLVTISPNEAAAVERIQLWRADPAQQVRDLFKIEPDRWQLEALEAFASTEPKKRRIALAACAGPGKSAVESWCGWNFMTCYADKDQHPNGAAVSITKDNLTNGLWKELAVWRNRSDFLTRAFEQTSMRIESREHPDTWFMGARSFAKTADQDAMGRTLSGLHAPYMLYLLDESGDMPTAVLRSAEQGLGNCKWGKIVQGGNTTSQTGALYLASSTQRHLWHLINITADPDDPNRTPRVDAEWAREQIALYGRDNPWVMAFILGQFPLGGINTLLTPDDVNAALGRGIKADDYQHVQKRLGIDVARFGDDRTVIFPRQGLRAFSPVVLRHNRGHEIAARVALAKTRWGSEMEFIDDTGGWGAGTIDACLLGNIVLIPVNNSAAADDSRRYFNRRSENYFRAAEWVKRGGALPKELTEIVREATAATYYFDKGKFRVVEKAQMKKLMNGVSPDLWDALVNTFTFPDMPASDSPLSGANSMATGGHAETEYDPYSDGRNAGAGHALTEYDPFA
jgi:hypothetical protein